ncbi:MAG: OmpA family protein [Parcubacteria group bacterium]|nr:OmpA family protein [Parcubacteria group bacterium]
MEEWDKTRTVRVRLGGSQAFTMDEALQFYGVDPSAGNPFKRSYEYYGDLAVDLWPEDISSYPAFDDVFNGEYLLAASKLEGVEGGGIAAPDFAKASSAPGQVIGSRSWQISFKSGSAQFNTSAAGDLDELATLLVMAESTRVEIHGYTDSQGEAETNLVLSEDRAFAVKVYLQEIAPATFPKDRITVHPHGEDNPLESNGTPQGRATNRRVEVRVITL